MSENVNEDDDDDDKVGKPKKKDIKYTIIRYN